MMKKVQVAAAVAFAPFSVSFAQQAVQRKVGDGGNRHWYRVLSPIAYWAQVRTIAVANGGHPWH